MRVFCSHTPSVAAELLSAVNDLNTTNLKNLVNNSTLNFLMSERPKQVSMIFEAAHCMTSEVIDNLFILSSTSVRSAATMKYWKNTTNATFGIDEKELIQVVLLQIHGGDGIF